MARAEDELKRLERLAKELLQEEAALLERKKNLQAELASLPTQLRERVHPKCQALLERWWRKRRRKCNFYDTAVSIQASIASDTVPIRLLPSLPPTPPPNPTLYEDSEPEDLPNLE